MINRLKLISNSKLKKMVSLSKTFNSVLSKIPLSQQNINRRRLRKELNKRGISYGHFSIIRKTKNISGQRFGKLVVVGINPKCNSGRKLWLCKCDCGQHKSFSKWHLENGERKSCGCINKMSGNHNWKGFGDVSGKYFYSIKNGAKKRGLTFRISIKEVWDLFCSQNKKCALTGLDICMDSGNKQTASLDRIHNEKGYISGNVWWIHKDINRMKNHYPLKYFVNMCSKIAIKGKVYAS